MMEDNAVLKGLLSLILIIFLGCNIMEEKDRKTALYLDKRIFFDSLQIGSHKFNTINLTGLIENYTVDTMEFLMYNNGHLSGSFNVYNCEDSAYLRLNYDDTAGNINRSLVYVLPFQKQTVKIRTILFSNFSITDSSKIEIGFSYYKINTSYIDRTLFQNFGKLDPKTRYIFKKKFYIGK